MAARWRSYRGSVGNNWNRRGRLGFEGCPLGRNGEFFEFGIGPNNESDDLLLAGASSDFNQETQIWLRMQLSKEFGDSTLQFFVEHQAEGDRLGWSPLSSWSLQTDQDYNIHRATRPELGGLAPGTYKVFVLIDGKKRVKGQFDNRGAPEAKRSQ